MYFLPKTDCDFELLRWQDFCPRETSESKGWANSLLMCMSRAPCRSAAWTTPSNRIPDASAHQQNGRLFRRSWLYCYLLAYTNEYNHIVTGFLKSRTRRTGVPFAYGQTALASSAANNTKFCKVCKLIRKQSLIRSPDSYLSSPRA